MISCRFALAYVDWRSMLPRIGPLLRPGGRVGTVNATCGSIPQAFKVYEDLRDSPRTVWKLMQYFGKDVGRAWALYRSLRADLRHRRASHGAGPIPKKSGGVAR